jgi:hypothetical protein
MDSRRFRKTRQTEIVDRARWLGWVMLMMFVLTQVASGAGSSVGALRRHVSDRAWLGAEAESSLLTSRESYPSG